MLRWRLISAAIIVSLLTLLVVLDYQRAIFGVVGLWLLPLLLAVSLLASEEVLSLMRAKGHRPVAWVVYAGNLLIPLAASLPLWYELAGTKFPPDAPLGRFGWPLVVLALAAVVQLYAEMQRFHAPGQATVNAALGVFALVYVGLLFSFLALLRLFHSNEWGLLALLSVIVVVKMADTGAYAFGKNFGRHKLTPILSPGKTWEGAAGGLVTACLTSWAWFHWAGPWLVGTSYVEPPLWGSLLYGAVLMLAGMVGDLAESMLKRDMGQKDSSSWLRGLGGVLDIIDSMLVAAPVAYVCWLLGLVGPGP